MGGDGEQIVYSPVGFLLGFVEFPTHRFGFIGVPLPEVAEAALLQVVVCDQLRIIQTTMIWWKNGSRMLKFMA